MPPEPPGPQLPPPPPEIPAPGSGVPSAPEESVPPTPGAGVAPAPGAGSWLLSGWPTALVYGLLAFGVMAVLGQVAAFAVYAVGDPGDLPVSTFVRIGWFYFGAFHHVSLVVSVPNLDLSALPGATGGSLPTGGSVAYDVGLALLLVTALGIALLYRGGREVADRAGGGAAARVLHGLKVAPVYALPVFVLSLLVSIRTSIPLGGVNLGDLELKLSTAQSLILPLVLAAAAGAAGGMSSALRAGDAPRLGRLAGVLSGGWRMLLVGLGLSYLGLFVAGALQPDDPVALATPSTASYFRAIAKEPDAGLTLLAHHLAIAPNEAMWVLVPAMGSCDGAYGEVGYTFLCYDRYPKSVSVPGLNSGLDPSQLLPSVEYGWIPAFYYLFLLAPALAVLLGGRRAAKRGLPRTRSEAAALGGAAGVVFAILVIAVGYLSTVSLGVSASFLGFGTTGSIRLGPDLVSGGLVALAWGAVGGALGGLFEGRSLPSKPPAVGPTATGFEPPAATPSV